MKQMRNVSAMLLSMLMVLTMMPLFSAAVSAQTLTDGSYRYTVTEDGTAQIAMYTGSEATVTVPATLGGYAVTSIGRSAFTCNHTLETVVFPSGVTQIGANAFSTCSQLKSVTLSNTVERIEKSAFASCGNLATVRFSAGLRYVGDQAFSSTGLTAVTFPEGLEAMGDSVLSYCENLQTLTIPSTVKTIGTNPCVGSKKVTVIRVTAGNTAYCSKSGVLYTYNMARLVAYPAGKSDTAFTVSASTRRIGVSAFANCEKLTSVTLPAGLKTVDDGVFQYCTALTAMHFPSATETIGNFALTGCTALGTLTIPDSVVTIGYNVIKDTALYDTPSNWTNNALYVGNHLIRVKSASGKYTVKDGTRSIAGYAFSGLSGVTAVVVPEGVVGIGERGFSGLSGMKTLILPAQMQVIGANAFANTTALTTVHYGGDEAQWTAMKIGDDNTYLLQATRIYRSIGVVHEGDYSYIRRPDGTAAVKEYRGTATTLVIPSAVGEYVVTEIESNVFASKAFITAVEFPETITMIGDCAFLNCNAIRTLELPLSVTTIKASAFQGCLSLGKVTVPESVTSIDATAFNGCTGLTIRGYAGSYAQTYANENAISFERILNGVLGDMNGDGTCAMTDAFVLYAAVSGKTVLTAEQTELSDVNNDGTLSILDAFYLYHIVSGRG